MPKKTWERIPDIETFIKETILNADLGIELKEVIIGDKSRSAKFIPPLIWVAPSPTRIDDESLALNERWGLRYTIVAVIKEHDVNKGRLDAMKLALKASALFIKPSSARQMGGNAHDTVRTNWLPAQNTITNEDTLFGAGVEIEIRFNTKEA